MLMLHQKKYKNIKIQKNVQKKEFVLKCCIVDVAPEGSAEIWKSFRKLSQSVLGEKILSDLSRDM